MQVSFTGIKTSWREKTYLKNKILLATNARDFDKYSHKCKDGWRQYKVFHEDD